MRSTHSYIGSRFASSHQLCSCLRAARPATPVCACLQIPDGDGALALHVMPRYILHNNLLEGVQYKQQVPPTPTHCQHHHLLATALHECRPSSVSKLLTTCYSNLLIVNNQTLFCSRII